jgi:hypothetical protein
MTPSKNAISFAAAAALIAITGASLSAPAMAKDAKLVHCYGVNSCKGTSDCKSGNHDCKGQNDCKGQGFKAESQSQCKADGGSLTAPK